jgi:hypothetical protein
VLARPILDLAPVPFSPIVADRVAKRVYPQNRAAALRVDGIILK